MRKLRPYHKVWLKRHARRLNQRRVSWKEWKRDQRNGIGRRRATIYKDGQQKQIWAERAIPAPEVFSLDSNYTETLLYITQIRDRLFSNNLLINRNKRRGHLKEYADFGTIKDISPTAALVLAAEFDRYRHLTGLKFCTVDEHRWDYFVLSVLRSLGFHELLEMKPLSSEQFDLGSTRVLQFLSGEQAIGESVGRLQDALAELLPDDAAQRLLYAEPYGGIFEAILNSWSWAYPEGHSWLHPSVHRWWMTGYVDTSENFVTIAVYDQGVTIPFSLPFGKYAERHERLLSKVLSYLKFTGTISDMRLDGLAIRTAMKIAKTSTGLLQHGKGLHSMQEVAERAEYGRLRILSRHGEYIWETGTRPTSQYNELPFHGTLIEWQLGLGKER
ncbi:hypothetical protein [Methylobacterium sp. WL120]|uniref:hypothetical protein n=1 Tax=Methylobacterium sp. WL120 TaxID=2603887 RepID=UPI0011C79E46|nr:hypothetical protein [Methylobacterium sp. WL120]TXM65791.1 hypothetical protein FV229_14525 [Methylobacterium sp. WL120]